ncbi:MAG: TonB-dependent receptor [Myxococcota bacterium]
MSSRRMIVVGDVQKELLDVFRPRRPRRSRALCVLVSVTPCFLGATTYAQEPDPSGDEEEVETIVITGTRQQTTLQDADVAATVLTSDTLTEARVTDFRRIDDLVPNVQFNDSGQVGGVYINIRGVESNLFIVNRAAVYIDGIPFRELSNSVLSELGSVEILRGPQSTLYGANAESGLVLIRTRAPSEAFEANARFTASTFAAGESYVSEGYVGGAIVQDVLAGSVNVKYSDEARFIENIGATPQGPGQIEELFVQSRLRFTPNDRLEVNATAYIIDINAPGVYRFDAAPVDIDQYNRVYNDGVLFDANDPASPPPVNGELRAGEFDLINDAPKRAEIEELVVGVSGSYEVSFGTFKAALSYRTEDADDRGFDIDRTNGPVLAGAVVDSKEVISGELVFQSDPYEPLTYLVGVTAYRDEETESLGSLVDATQGLGGFAFAPTQTRGSEDYGVFASTSYNPGGFLSDWTFTLGARYDIAKRETSQDEGILDLGFTQFFFEEQDLEDTFEQFLPRVAARYEPTNNLTFFANAAKGYIPGGFNLAATAEEFLGDFIRYESETLWSYDTGAKWRAPELGVRASAAAFFIQADNWQEISGAVTDDGQAGSTAFIVSAAEIESRGFEIEGQWDVTDRLSVTANFGYTDAEYTDFSQTEQEVIGNPVKFIPKYDANLAVRYAFPLGFFVRAEADFLGELPLNEGNFGDLQRLGITGIQVQDPTQVYGLQVGYRNEFFSGRIFAENLTNERRFSGLGFPNAAFPTDSTLYAPIDVPRVVGLELELRY